MKFDWKRAEAKLADKLEKLDPQKAEVQTLETKGWRRSLESRIRDMERDLGITQGYDETDTVIRPGDHIRAVIYGGWTETGTTTGTDSHVCGTGCSCPTDSTTHYNQSSPRTRAPAPKKKRKKKKPKMRRCKRHSQFGCTSVTCR